MLPHSCLWSGDRILIPIVGKAFGRDARLIVSFGRFGARCICPRCDTGWVVCCVTERKWRNEKANYWVRVDCIGPVV